MFLRGHIEAFDIQGRLLSSGHNLITIKGLERVAQQMFWAKAGMSTKAGGEARLSDQQAFYTVAILGEGTDAPQITDTSLAIDATAAGGAVVNGVLHTQIGYPAPLGGWMPEGVQLNRLIEGLTSYQWQAKALVYWSALPKTITEWAVANHAITKASDFEILNRGLFVPSWNLTTDTWLRYTLEVPW